MNPFRKKLVVGFSFLPWVVVGCGQDDLTISEQLIIGIVGTFTAPEGASGNAEPKTQTLTLNDVTMTDSDGNSIDLYDEDPLEVVVLNRSQIILETDIGDHEDTVISSVTVTFATAIKAAGKYEDDLSATLTSGAVTHTEEFTVESGKSPRFDVQVQWKNTITRDDDAETETLSAPALASELTGS